jgi:hypothetical protein
MKKTTDLHDNITVINTHELLSFFFFFFFSNLHYCLLKGVVPYTFL